MAHMHTTEITSVPPSPPAEAPSEPIAEISATLLRAQAFLSGCAIALMVREGAWLVCRASNGAAAPEIGARMEVDHSFLGLCVTQKKPHSCEDADSDLRVENVAYSRLRPKSILAVPVRAGQEVLAVLAGFSAAPNAFTHTQIAILRTVADALSRPVQQLPLSPPADAPARSPEPWPSSPRDAMQERAAKPEPQPAVPPPPPAPPVAKPREEVLALADEPAPPPRPPEPRPTPPTVRIVKLPVPRTLDLPRPRPRWRFRPALFRIATLTVLCLMCALATAGWYSTRIPDAPRVYTAPILTPPVPPTTQAEPVVARVPEVHEASVSAIASAPELKPRADVATHPEPPTAEPPVSAIAPPTPLLPKLPPAEAPAEEAPTLALNSAAPLPALVAPHAAAPGIHQSHATAAQLVQQVPPRYPPVALSRRMAGEVTLSVLIRKDGSVGDVKVLRGNPVFHMSALDAVRQWRYSPATLDGQPVEAHADVVLKFDLPVRR
ncbi:MAG TPA: TonB family protein [Terriglobales bacterium]|nr:TonB family protein [Terriglobales bacterium]